MRYTNINQARNLQDTGKLGPRYIKNNKYPEIAISDEDIYVITVSGDRYDLLAQTYYYDHTLWWIISRANLNLSDADSLYPPIGEQIRIPAPNRIANILSRYAILNGF
jgi:hypothetical protein